MDTRWLHKGTAVALAALALFPVAILSAGTPSARGGPSSVEAADAGTGPLHGISGFDAPTIDALQRGMESGLFASFEWNGLSVRGSFVEFGFDPRNGTISSFTAKRGTESLALVYSVRVTPFNATGPAFARGPVFTAPGAAITIRAHDDPSGLLELRSLGHRHQVVFQLFGNMTTVTDLTQSATWPAASLAFAIGGSRGRLLLGAGTLNLSGSTVFANMTEDDLLVMKSIPGFSEILPERAAMLDAFAQGRLAVELGLVAQTDGAWIENSARFRTNLSAYAAKVTMGHASFLLSSGSRGGLLLLGFDPATMPADAGRRIVLRWKGEEIPESRDTLSAFYAPSGNASKAFFTRLPLEATVLVVYLPSLAPSSLTVDSEPADEKGFDWSTELALVAAVALVSAAAGYMFRRRRE